MTLLPKNFRVESEIIDALQRIKKRDGVPVSEQVRRALTDWIKKKGDVNKEERKRETPRKRPPNPIMRLS